MLTRRHSSPAPPRPLAAPAILRAQTVFRRYPFSLGVAAGDPSPDGFVIWTRLAPEPLDRAWRHGDGADAGEVGGGVGRALRHASSPRARKWRGPSSPTRSMSRSPGSSPTGLIGTASPSPASAASRAARARCRSPRPAPRRCASASAAARAMRTAITPPIAISPARSSPSSIIMATISTNIAAARSGRDASGELVQAAREIEGDTLYDIADYRRRYAQYKADPDLQRAHAAHAFFHSYRRS